MKLPLEDIKVLDLSHALAGPFCSTMLADFGAQVIKLEPPGAGDIARGWGAPMPGGETAYFVSLHRNKRGIVVDLKHPQGKELFFRLVERCDVVLENYRVGALARLGIDYAAARLRNPGIIYCSISGFGQDGPYCERAALDLILQAESGMISVTGEPGSSGTRAGVSIADMTAGLYAAYGVMLALRVKEKTGVGQAVDISMLEGQLALLGTSFGNYFANGEVPKPMGTAYPAVLLTTGANDPRVAPWQSRKFAASLQDATTSGQPVLLLTRMNAGHGIGAPFSQRVGNAALSMTFFATELGLGE